jgi:hypothetical protein
VALRDCFACTVYNADSVPTLPISTTLIQSMSYRLAGTNIDTSYCVTLLLLVSLAVTLPVTGNRVLVMCYIGTQQAMGCL